MSGFGAASAHSLGFARLRAAAGGPDIRWIACEGSADAVVAALGGHTDAAHTNYNIVREHLRAGTMRVLGIALPVEALPDTPSYAEQGYDLQPVHRRGGGPAGAGPRDAGRHPRPLHGRDRGSGVPGVHGARRPRVRDDGGRGGVRGLMHAKFRDCASLVMDDAGIDVALRALERVDELGHIGELVRALSTASAS